VVRLSWERIHDFEIGLDRGVYFPQSGPAEAWNGLISVDETPSDENDVARYIDGVKTYQRRRPGDFTGRIEAYTYPSSLESVIFSRGSQSFGFSYRISKHNGFLIHLVYNVRISPDGFLWNQSESSSFAWNFTTTPIEIPGARPSAHVIVDTHKAYSTTVQEFEDVLYGNDSNSARLPSPEEVLEIFESNSIVRVIDHGDGTYTITGPDEVVQLMDSTTWKVDWPSAVYIDADSFSAHSL
jgi:hypothetical protein